MDKYINATHLDSVLDDVLEIIELDKSASSFQKTCCKMSVEYAKEILKREIAAGGEFRPVTHAHWVSKYGNYVCSNCDTRSYDKEDGESFNLKEVIFCPYCGAIMDEPEVE
jgi:DNA-directed RNA polymerase subunit RPC12/RpoP|nr:MAG TPA: Transcription initiation factor IIE, alpha FINGER, Transcription [Bacteriophage sp.]